MGLIDNHLNRKANRDAFYTQSESHRDMEESVKELSKLLYIEKCMNIAKDSVANAISKCKATFSINKHSEDLSIDEAADIYANCVQIAGKQSKSPADCEADFNNS